MTSRLLQTELSLAALRLQTSQDKLHAEIGKLQDAIAQLNQMLRYRLECLHPTHTHPTCHTSNTNSTKVTNRAQGLRSNASTSNDCNTGSVTEDLDPVETSTTTAASHFQTPALLNAFTDAAGITAYNTDTCVAFRVDSAVLCSKSSGITSITTGDTYPTITTSFLSSTAANDAILKISPYGNPLLSTSFVVFLFLLATTLHPLFASFTGFPAPTILPLPRPPPEPDPNHEGRRNNNDNCGNTKTNQQ